MIDYNLQFTGIAVPFWIALAIIASGAAAPAASRLRVEAIIAVLLLGIAARAGFFLAVSSGGRHAEARGDVRAALVWYDRAAGKEWFSRDLLLSRARLLLESGDAVGAEEATLDALRENDQDGRSWKLLGMTLEAQGNLQAAREAYNVAFTRLRWNDLDAVTRTVALLPPEQFAVRREEFDALFVGYARAIELNVHFIALSSNVESLLAFGDLLAERFPEDAPRYHVFAARAERQARTEREKLRARAPGFLW